MVGVRPAAIPAAPELAVYR